MEAEVKDEPKAPSAEERALYLRLLDNGLMLPTRALLLVLAEIRAATQEARRQAFEEAARWHDVSEKEANDASGREDRYWQGWADGHADAAAHFRSLADSQEGE